MRSAGGGQRGRAECATDLLVEDRVGARCTGRAIGVEPEHEDARAARGARVHQVGEVQGAGRGGARRLLGGLRRPGAHVAYDPAECRDRKAERDRFTGERREILEAGREATERVLLAVALTRHECEEVLRGRREIGDGDGDRLVAAALRHVGRQDRQQPIEQRRERLGRHAACGDASGELLVGLVVVATQPVDQRGGSQLRMCLVPACPSPTDSELAQQAHGRHGIVAGVGRDELAGFERLAQDIGGRPSSTQPSQRSMARPRRVRVSGMP
jgi:hypothetical protein